MTIVPRLTSPPIPPLLKPVRPADDNGPVGPGGDPPESFTILVVDDNEANRDVLSRRLQRRGYVTVKVEDGPSALSAIENQVFDLVLLDVMMPGMSGLEVLEEIRKTRSPTDLPVIMATAKDQSEDVVMALNMGANDYVTKPLDFAVVMARVQFQLMLRRSVQQVLQLQQTLGTQNDQLQSVNGKLTDAYNRMNGDLEAAARIQESYLPTNLPKIPGYEFAWAYQPCEHLAGDFLNVCPIDEDHVGIYVLDVSGHGVSAALLAVAAARALSPAPDPDSILIQVATADVPQHPTPPAEVADRLNQKFNWESNPGQFITIFYALLDIPGRKLTYVSAGHPGAIVLHADGSTEILSRSGLPIGVGEPYKQTDIALKSRDRVYLYTDGVTEAMNAAGDLYGHDRMIASLQASAPLPLKESIEELKKQVAAWRGTERVRDDISILAVECHH
jgi:sigma-B regulation protein RsbU (phosphoserine phosphatase)